VILFEVTFENESNYLEFVFIQLLEKAGPVAGMTDGTDRSGFNKYGIVIAVLPHLDSADEVAGGSPFVPEFLAAAAVKPDIAAGERLIECLLIHITDHQDFAVIGVLYHRRYEASGIEFNIFEHITSLKVSSFEFQVKRYNVSS
jgi:hypothetical protein